MASSSEQLAVARTVASLLSKAGRSAAPPQPRLDVHAWTEKTFTFSSTYIESLERELDRADFAVVIMTADDAGLVRREHVNLPRDNVIFELGLFIGRLGRQRCFFFIDASNNTRVASDLSGVKEVDFVHDRNLAPGVPDRRLATRCRDVAVQMLQLGERYKPSGDTRARNEEVWRVAKGIAGHWWSFRYWDLESVGLVELTPDTTSLAVHVEGKAFSPEAPNQALASWESVASTLVRLGPSWTLYYTWEGFYPRNAEQRFKGSSRYDFRADRERPETGSGSLLEANLTNLQQTTEKAIELRRCALEEVVTMNGDDSKAKRALLQAQIARWRGKC